MSSQSVPVQEIRKAVVIGAGAMGSGIAAQLANAGVPVYLLDIAPVQGERSAIAQNAIQRMLKAKPAADPLNAGLMLPTFAERITPGNIEDHLEEAVRDADWIVEVVVENLAVKKDLFARLEALAAPTAIISSNTSTIPLRDLIQGRSAAFRRRFVITHFFNPPRFMHLLEIVTGEETDPSVTATIRAFGDVRLGKRVVVCKDTPAFLANRIGIYFMFRAITEAFERKMPIEQVDAALGSPIGFPKEGIFGLLDLVGIGIIPLVTESLLRTLPEDDPFRGFDHDRGLQLIDSLLKAGCFGRNSPCGGFYRMQKGVDGSRRKQAIDLQTGEYYDVEKPRLHNVSEAKKHGPRAVFESDGPLGRFAWVVVRDTLLYAARLIPEIADDIADVDVALRGGYNARWGPFELIDKLGVPWFTQKVLEDGIPLPTCLKIAGQRPFYRDHQGSLQRLTFDFKTERAEYEPLPEPLGVLRLADVQRKGKPLLQHHSASLWDIGDGVTCLEFHSKMNTLDPSTLWTLHRSIGWMKRHADRYRAMVIHNEGKNFSLGANLALVEACLKMADHPLAKASGLSAGIWKSVEALVYWGQRVFSAMRYAPFPVVGAPQGMALGGGCEILLHCDHVQASAETYMGLVEVGVGLIPAWGGCVRALALHTALHTAKDPATPLGGDGVPARGGVVPPVRNAFQAIMTPQSTVSASGMDAIRQGWLPPGSGITMNPDRLLADAKALALRLAEGYAPPKPELFRLPGPPGKAALRMAVDDFYLHGDANHHDVIVADALADVLTGGSKADPASLIAESDLYRLEREGFLSLLRMPATRKRIAQMLKTGKPFREPPLTDAPSLDDLRRTRVVPPCADLAVTGHPLTGGDAFRLWLMATLAAWVLKLATRTH